VHGWIGDLISRLIFAFAQHHRLGVAFSDGIGYIVARDPDVVRGPDVSFVSRSRLPEGQIPQGLWPFAPDLAVEVMSPSDRPSKIRAKALEYLAGGSRVAWVVDPERRSVTAYFADGTVKEFGPEDSLDGSPVLPGFHVRVADLFVSPA
jgi:Uma2 family endonuclease